MVVYWETWLDEYICLSILADIKVQEEEYAFKKSYLKHNMKWHEWISIKKINESSLNPFENKKVPFHCVRDVTSYRLSMMVEGKPFE